MDIGVNMRVTITYCDDCNRCNDGDDETPVGHYRSYPKMGEEGYLIDMEDMDLCKDCLKRYKEKHPNWNVFYIDHNARTILI